MPARAAARRTFASRTACGAPAEAVPRVAPTLPPSDREFFFQKKTVLSIESHAFDLPVRWRLTRMPAQSRNACSDVEAWRRRAVS